MKYDDSLIKDNIILKQSYMNYIFTAILKSKAFQSIIDYTNQQCQLPLFIFSGVGKNWYICEKVVKTFISLGINAQSLDPSHALHGDVGMLNTDQNKIIFFISRSGKTDEIIKLVKVINYFRKNNIYRNMYTVGFHLNPSIVDELKCMYDIQLLPDDVSILNSVCELDGKNIIPSLSINTMQLIIDTIGIIIFQNNNVLVDKYHYNHLAGSNGKKTGGDKILEEILNA